MLPIVSLTAVVGYGCSAPDKENEIYPPGVLHGTSKNIGEDIKEVIGKDFDLVTVEEICSKRVEDKCVDYDVIVRGHIEIKGVYRPICGWNIDNVCDAYSTGIPLAQVLLGRETYAETARGEVVHCNLGRNRAYKLVEILRTRGVVNEERCRDWREMIGKNYGPLGHIVHPRKKGKIK